MDTKGLSQICLNVLSSRSNENISKSFYKGYVLVWQLHRIQQDIKRVFNYVLFVATIEFSYARIGKDSYLIERR